MDLVVLFDNFNDIAVRKTFFKASLFKFSVGFKDFLEDFWLTLKELISVKIH